jgi:hypothetical protein
MAKVEEEKAKESPDWQDPQLLEDIKVKHQSLKHSAYIIYHVKICLPLSLNNTNYMDQGPS